MIELRKKLINFVAWLAIGVVFVVGGFNITPVVIQKSDLEKTRLELQEKINSTEKKIRDLRDKQNDFSTDYEYVEYILHEKKHVWKNETIFIFDD